MNKEEKLYKVSEQFGSGQNHNPPMRIDWMFSTAWTLLHEREDTDNTCLVYLAVENRIGIADRNIPGYTPTPCVIHDGVDGVAAVNWFNENILGHTVDRATRIVLSTMRG